MSNVKVLVIGVICLLNSYQNAFCMDCAKAKTTTELAICNDKNLLDYDAALSFLYADISKKLDGKDKAIFIEGQKAFLKERDAIKPDLLLHFYRNRIQYLAANQKSISKQLMLSILHSYQSNMREISSLDSILISSYIKANIQDYTHDKDIEETLSNNDFDNTNLIRLNDKAMLLAVALMMGAYQGQALSFLYDGQDISLISFQRQDNQKKMIKTFVVSNYITWEKPFLVIHERSAGFLYECGDTFYYTFQAPGFTLAKQVTTPCNAKEIDAIQRGTLKTRDLKNIVIYSDN